MVICIKTGQDSTITCSVYKLFSCVNNFTIKFSKFQNEEKIEILFLKFKFPSGLSLISQRSVLFFLFGVDNDITLGKNNFVFISVTIWPDTVLQRFLYKIIYEQLFIFGWNSKKVRPHGFRKCYKSWRSP